MATIIQIKRTGNATAPTTVDLAEAELAYSQDKANNGANAILYIESLDSGDAAVIHKVGGKYYTDIVDAATDANTNGTIVKRDSTGSFAANVITADQFIGNVTATSAATLTTPRYINLSGDLEGNVLFDGSTDVTIVANVISNGVELGTDTTGDYVANVLAGTGIEVTGQGGEIANVTVTLANTAVSPGTYGGATQIPTFEVDAQGRLISATNVSVSTAITLGADTGSADTLSNGDTLRVLGGTGIDTTVTDNTITVAIETSGVTANTYGGASKIPVFTVDATGRLTTAANVDVAGVTNFTASGNTFTISTADGNTFNASIQVNSVRLGDDTTGDYLSNVLAGTGIVISGQGGETATPTVTLDTSGVVAATYGSTTNIPVIVVDTYGRITSASNASISTDLLISADTGTDTVSLATETLAIEGGTGIATDVTSNIITITNLGVTSLTGTTNEVNVSAANGAITIGLPDDVIIGGDLSVTGNLFVTGNVTSIGVDSFLVSDPLIHLANNNTSTDIVDIGFEGHYYDSTFGQRHTGLFRDASDGGLYKLFANVSAELEFATTVDTDTANGFTIATLVANLTQGSVSNLTVAIDVADGGTGRASLTQNAILFGEGTSDVGLAVGTFGQVLQIGANGMPIFSGIDGGSY